MSYSRLSRLVSLGIAANLDVQSESLTSIHNGMLELARAQQQQKQDQPAVQRPCCQPLREHRFMAWPCQGFFADKDAGAKAAGQKVEKTKAPTEQYADFMKAR